MQKRGQEAPVLLREGKGWGTGNFSEGYNGGTPLCRIRVQLRGPFKPVGAILSWYTWGFRERRSTVPPWCREALHADKSNSNFFRIERETIVVTVFLLIMNQRDYRWVHNQKENSHYDRIRFNFRIAVFFIWFLFSSEKSNSQIAELQWQISEGR